MKEMKGVNCELCKNQARVYCESDEARLCFECDGKVHAANFLVAKHCRSLLCHICQTPTPWKASGPKLGPTISVCQNCFPNNPNNNNNNSNPRGNEEEEENNLQSEEDESCRSESSDDDEDYSSCSDSEDYDDGENQVVPWSCCSSSGTTSSYQPPLPASSSSSEEDVVRDCGATTVSSSSKRMRHLHYLDSDDEDECFSNPNNDKASSMECEMPSSSSVRQAKTSGDLIEHIKGEISDPERRRRSRRRRVSIESSLTRFQQIMVDDEHDASTLIRGISRMTGNN